MLAADWLSTAMYLSSLRMLDGPMLDARLAPPAPSAPPGGPEKLSSMPEKLAPLVRVRVRVWVRVRVRASVRVRVRVRVGVNVRVRVS